MRILYFFPLCRIKLMFIEFIILILVSGSYFGATIILLAMSTALTVVILNIHHRGAFGNKVPKWIRTVVLNWLASVMLLKDKVEDNVSAPNQSNKVENTFTDQVQFCYTRVRPIWSRSILFLCAQLILYANNTELILLCI